MIRRQVRATILKCYVLGLSVAAIGILLLLRVQSPLSDVQLTISVLALAAGVTALAWAVALTVRPDWHPSLRRLAAFGPARRVAAEIDREAADPSTLRFGTPLRSFRLENNPHPPVLVTRSWVVQVTYVGTCVARLDDILGVRMIRERDVLGRRSVHGVEVLAHHGRDERFFLQEGDAHRLLVELMTRLPWIQGGFDLWGERFNPAERQRLSEAICQERERLQSVEPAELPALIDDKVRHAGTEAEQPATDGSTPSM
jgi:hypothetical protein